MKHTIFLLTVLLFFLDLPQGAAQPDLDAFEYRFVGPMRGGRVTAVAGTMHVPGTFYMGATGGGVWKTEDYGTSWMNISDGYFGSPSIGAIRVAESDPNIIYVGTGSDGLRSNVIAGDGVYKSIDAGKTWSHVGLAETGHIGAVEIHPGNHNIAFVAAIGNAFAANPERGVYRTTDGGENWERVLFLSDSVGFVDVEFLPGNPEVIYASAWQAERKPWTISSGGLDGGIYKSVNGGDTWKKLTKGLPDGIIGKIDLAVCRSDSRILYALIEAREGAGLYRSTDQGKSFELVSNKRELLDRPFYYCNVDVDPNDPDLIYVNSTRFWRSKDGGKSWVSRPVPHGDNHDIWINPNNSKLMVQANDGGANVSINGGVTWSTQFNQPTAELYQVEVDDQHPYWLYAGQQDNYTTISVPSQPPYGMQAGNLGWIMNTGGCETGPAVPKPGDPDIVYANCKGRFSVYNKRTGQEMRYDVGAANMYGHNPRDLKFRFQRVAPIHVSPHDPDVVYHCSQFVHKTTDDGKTWEIISPDLTAFEPDKQVISGSPITRDITGEEFYSTIYAIRESPLEAGLLWVGANDGPVHVSRDGGANWTKVTPAGLPPNGRVDCVEPSPHSPSKAYVAVLRYQLGDSKPYIYRTNNYGQNWSLLTDGKNGLPADCPTRVVREDPERPGMLYAGTECGVYVSFDDGRSWHGFQQNLPVTPVTDIKVAHGDLVLSTMGRGFWIMDDLSPLRQGFEEADGVTFFKPRDTYRSRFSGGRSTGSGPRYLRPAVGFDYYLPEAIESGVRLDIINSEGLVVRSLVSQEGDTEQPAGAGERDMATGIPAPVLSRGLKHDAGLHRYRWDMRHPGAWHKTRSRRYSNGPHVLPGSYTARLTVGDQVLEQPFIIMMDPDVEAEGVTIEDLGKQERLSLDVVQLMSEARMLEADLQDALKEAESADPDAEKVEALKERIDQLVTQSGRYMQPKLIDQISYLYGILTRADQAPGQDAYTRYGELRTRFNEVADVIDP